MLTNGDGIGVTDFKYKLKQLAPEQLIKNGYLRQGETKTALSLLALAEENIVFLGYPDRCSAYLWRENWDRPFTSHFTQCNATPYTNSFRAGALYTGKDLTRDVTELIRRFQPTHIVYPHFYDRHVDHFAAHNFIKYAVAASGVFVKELTYLMHRGHWPAPSGKFPFLRLIPPQALGYCGGKWYSLRLSPRDIKRKRMCLRQYKSQNLIMRMYLLSFLRRNELFAQYDDLRVAPSAIRRNGRLHVYIANPYADTLKAYLNKAADISELRLVISRRSLVCVLKTTRRPRYKYRYLFDLVFFKADGLVSRLLLCIENKALTIKKIIDEAAWPFQASWSMDEKHVTISLTNIDLLMLRAILVNAVTFKGSASIDRTGSRLIRFVERQRGSKAN